jgi:hypothetical protein
MATAADVTVEPDDATIHISDLTVRDSDLAAFLDDHTAEEQADLTARAVEIGLQALRLGTTARDLEFVQHEFEQMKDALDDELDDVREDLHETFGDDGDVQQLLDDHLGDDGQLRGHLEDAFEEDGLLSERLDDELGEDGERIQDALDPSREGTPTHQLKTDLREEIRSLRDKISEEAGREEERQQSWKKGEDFEETVANLLDDIVYQTAHGVEHTGDEEGEIPGRDVGDHVLTLAETGQRIVFESKSEQNYTAPKIKEEMGEAIENRDADYGIFVTECESYVPNKVGYFQEWDEEILVVALCHDEDDEIDPGFLRIAFNWAKIRTLQAHVDTGESVDPETIQAQVESVRDSIDRFSTVKTKCREIESTAREIKTMLDEIREDVLSDLNTVTTELSKAESP